MTWAGDRKTNTDAAPRLTVPRFSARRCTAAERVLLADRAAKLVVKVAALEAEAGRRPLIDTEVETLLQGNRMLGLVTRRLGIEPTPHRG